MSKEMREFMKTMGILIDSPNQKLIGDMKGGYVYAADANKPELMYAATEISKALEIKKVIFNNPATIVFWADGTKTVVKAENEDFDPEKGLAMAISKKALGNKGSYFNKIKEWTNRYNKEN